MTIGFDYWQVVSHYPVYFDYLAHLHRSNGDKVIIISAVGSDRLHTVASAIEKLNVTVDEVHEVLFQHPKESPQLKAELCKELGVDVFYDDRDDVCRELNQHGILAMRVTRKDNSTYDLGAEIS